MLACRKIKNALVNRHSFNAYIAHIICNRLYIGKLTDCICNRVRRHYSLFKLHLLSFAFLLFLHSHNSGYSGGFIFIIGCNIRFCFIDSFCRSDRFCSSCLICRYSINYIIIGIINSFAFFIKRLFQSVEMVKHAVKADPCIAVLFRLNKCEIHRSNFLFIFSVISRFAFCVVIPVRKLFILPCSLVDPAFQYIRLLTLAYRLSYYLFVLYLAAAFPCSNTLLLFKRSLCFVKPSFGIDCRTYCRRCAYCRRNRFSKFHILPTSRLLPKLLFNTLECLNHIDLHKPSVHKQHYYHGKAYRYKTRKYKAHRMHRSAEHNHINFSRLYNKVN